VRPRFRLVRSGKTVRDKGDDQYEQRVPDGSARGLEYQQDRDDPEDQVHRGWHVRAVDEPLEIHQHPTQRRDAQESQRDIQECGRSALQRAAGAGIEREGQDEGEQQIADEMDLPGDRDGGGIEVVERHRHGDRRDEDRPAPDQVAGPALVLLDEFFELFLGLGEGLVACARFAACGGTITHGRHLWRLRPAQERENRQRSIDPHAYRLANPDPVDG
jgi:hypothetical protein